MPDFGSADVRTKMFFGQHVSDLGKERWHMVANGAEQNVNLQNVRLHNNENTRQDLLQRSEELRKEAEYWERKAKETRRWNPSDPRG